MIQPGETPSPEKQDLKSTVHSGLIHKTLLVFVVFMAFLAVFIFVSERHADTFLQKGVSETVAVMSGDVQTPPPETLPPVVPDMPKAGPSVLPPSPVDHAMPMMLRLDDLALRVEKLEKFAASMDRTALQESANLLQDVARMRGDLVALSSALGMLQTQIQQAMQSSEQVRSASQGQMALAIAFTQLRAVAATGDSFTYELESLKKAAVNEPAVMAAAIPLDSLAATGVLPQSVLRDRFSAMSGAIRAEIRRANAKDWKDRIMAELMALVSIRPLDGAADGDEVTAIERELANNNIQAAAGKMSSLPQPVQDRLKPWKDAVEARRTLDASLNAIASHMIDQAMAKGHQSPPLAEEPPTAEALPAAPIEAPQQEQAPAPAPVPNKVAPAPKTAPKTPPVPAPSPLPEPAPGPGIELPSEPSSSGNET